MDDEKFCKNCKYLRIQDEYWHDHYLIPKSYYCVKGYSYCEVEPDGSCENFQTVTQKKKKSSK